MTRIAPLAPPQPSVAAAWPPERGSTAMAPETSPPAPALPNPRLRLDAGLGMVVLELRDESGALARSIPSQRELDAYRRAGHSGSTGGEGSGPVAGAGGPPGPSGADPPGPGDRKGGDAAASAAPLPAAFAAAPAG